MSKETVLNPQLPPVDGQGGEGTVLNPHLRAGSQGGEGTVLNPHLRSALPKEAAASEKTVLNPALPLEMVLQTGTRIGDRYEVLRRLDQTAGEADLFLCHDLRQPEESREAFVFKLYRRQQAVKKEVYQALKDIDVPAAFIDLRLMGPSPYAEKQEFVRAFIARLTELTGIDAHHIYLNIAEHEEWGAHGTLNHI